MSLSSRQIIFAGFLIVTAVLGAVILQSDQQLERLTERSQHVRQQAFLLFTALQSLDERSVDLERSVRQYHLTRQTAYRASFDVTLEQALLLIERLEQQKEHIPGLEPLLEPWRATLHGLADSLGTETESAFIGASFSHLAELRVRMRQVGQQWVDEQENQMTSRLRLALQLQIMLPFLGSVLVAFFISRWLTHTTRKVKNSITRLEQGNFDEPIAITGPSDIKRLGNRLDRLRTRLMESGDFKEEILRHAEQVLKARLSSLQNNVDLLNEGSSGSADNKVIGVLSSNLDSLKKLADYLSMVIKLFFEERGVQKRRVGLGDLLARIVESQNEHPRFSEVKVRVDCPPEKEAWLDTEKVVSVAGHIFKNALDFAPAGGEIRLSVYLEGKTIVLECLDQGPGILPDDAPHIFEPFYRDRFNPYDNAPGGRINLGIAKELAKIMEGDIQLLDASSGARFRVTLPYEPFALNR
ncbi:MAG: ATP-binding protein [Betaproteobacteria bacterium]|nr:ATP-binding protein [Betaproteobacteria bacterium]